MYRLTALTVCLTLAVVVAVGAAPGASEAAPAPAPSASPYPVPDIKEWQLANGLDVVYVGIHKAPVVTVQVWYHVGSKDEPPDRRGSAHMFEHMMYKGTVHVPPERYAQLIDTIGGSENAFTREDVTAYHQTVPRQYMDFAVELEAERMRGLLIRADMVKSEREGVKEEKRMRVDNSAIGKAFERFRAIAYTRHPYAWTAAGDLGDLDHLRVAQLQKFYDAYYRPNNATLVIVGDVSEPEVRAAAEKWFGPVERGPDPPRPSADRVEPKQMQERKETVGSSQLGVVIGGYHIPGARSDDIFPLQVLGAILAGGDSARINQRIVRKEQIGVFAGGQLVITEEPGLFLVLAAYLTPAQEPRIEAALADEIARLQKEPVSDHELDKARNQLTATYIESLQTVGGVAAQIGESRIMTGSARAWVDDYTKYQAVTAADVMRVAKLYLNPENLTLVIVPPAPGGAK